MGRKKTQRKLRITLDDFMLANRKAAREGTWQASLFQDHPAQVQEDL